MRTEKFNLCKSTKKLLTLITLLTLGVGQMWAWNSWSSKTIYFDNSYWASDGYTPQLLIGRYYTWSSDSRGSSACTMTNISGTDLWYLSSFSYSNYTNEYFISNSSTWGNEYGCNYDGCSNCPESRYTHATHYTNSYNTDGSAAYNLFVPASANNGANLSYTYNASYSTLLNSNQTIYQCVAENGGTPAKSTASIGTISISTKYLSGATAASNNNGSITSGNNSVTKSAARTATVTMTATSIASGYTFLGWYDAETGGTLLENSTTYTYKATGAKTVYARFSHETTHSVTIYYKCGSTNVTTQTSQAIGQVTASSITAPTVYGYTFTSWTLNTGISNQSASTSVNPISVKTLSSGTYNMTANYTEDLSSTWYVSGESSAIFGGWGSSGKNMQRKTGHSTEKRFYYTIDATKVINGDVSDSDLEFKIYNSSGDSYRGNSGYWVTRSNYQPTLSSSSGNNMQFRPDAYGTYEFKVDCESPYSESAPKLTVTFGTKRQVNFGKRTGCNTVTAKYNNSVSMTSGQYVINGSSVTFSQTASDGYTFEGWYNAASGGTRQSTSSSYTLTITGGNKTIYPNYTENKTSITITTDGHGTITTPSPVSNPYSLGVATTQAINASASTGYHWNSWTVSGTAALGTTATTASNTAKGNGTNGGTGTITATFSPNTYRVHFHRNGGSGTTVYQNFTYDVAQDLTANTYTKTGYNFAGWALAADAAVTYADGANVSNLTSDNGVDFHLYAKWTPKSCTVNFNFDESDPGHGSHTSATTSTSATYDAAMTSVTPPTAATGYAFMGYFTDADGAGTQYYDGSGNSAKNWAVDTEDPTTLYAYYKKAEITALTPDAAVVEPEATIGITPTISPTPVGPIIICWEVRYADTDNPLVPQPADMAYSEGKLTFTAPAVSALYKIHASLKTGSACGAGTELSTNSVNVQVAGSHTVTVDYKYSSTTIAASTAETGRPLVWSDPITAPDIFGYKFDHWTAGTGVSLSEDGENPLGEDESDEATIYIKANYNGTLTANYTLKNIVYFKDNLEWTDPDDADAHIYVNLLQSDYWNNDRGSGNYDRPNRNLEMDRVPGTTDIFYYEYDDKTTSNYISFTRESMGNSGDFYQEAPNVAHVVFPSRAMDALGTNNSSGLGFYAATPMFVPLATQTPVLKNSNRAAYYNDGYWTKYLPGTGYTLQIYNEDGSGPVKQIAFTSADELMPMKAVVDLEGGHTYKFQLKRDGDVYYGNNGTMTYEDHGQNTAWDFYNNYPFNMCTIVTNAAGDYTFNLSYSPNNGGTQNRLRMSVDYPVASGDYRLVYTDNTRSYVEDEVTKYRIKPSAIVNKVNDGTDIVSFFVRHNQTPKLYIQQATVDNEGNITWNEYPTSGTPTNQITGAIASTITSGGTGVYNFNLSMNGSGALSVTSAEAYDGEFYIRTDAANSKWDNYRTDPDHRLTSSDYLKSSVGYTHYYCHWVNKDDVGRKNVKFVIANDYSPCISDTLARETATGTWANIGTWMEEGGDLKRSANVRFMWDQETNAIARAYVDGAQGVGSNNFLKMLSADSKIKNQAETETLTEVYFTDNQNWIYEANIKAQTGAAVQLISNWGDNASKITQYFKGTAESPADLIGGSGDTWYAIRLLYDFKTNRLVAAYIPTGTITEETEINADVMFIREHQGDIEQLTFSGDGTITKIETAYGVMKFNKWTLNNKDKSTHNPLDPELSIFERSLYWISFPFRVKLSEVFGFGTYMSHWAIQRYDGARRAAVGHFLENGTFWRWMDRATEYLEPNQGYLLAIDLDLLGESSSVWGPNSLSEQIELYFPSYGDMPDLTKDNVVQTLEPYECTINRAATEGLPDTGNPATSYNRTIFDSHWRVMSVPTYVNTGNVTFANTTWKTKFGGPNFLYTWNRADNTITATSAESFTYHAMHSYMVQYCGTLTWSASSGSPYTPIVARKTYEEAPRKLELRLEIQQNEQMIDRTYVVMSNEEEVSANFAFGEDMVKEFNANKAAIFNYTADNVGVAGNTIPMSEQTTIVPVGVSIPKAGEYTFAIPDGTEGVGVILVDNVANTRTNLSALDYTVNLTTGTHDGRFVLEISPIHNATTGIEAVRDEGLEITGARKMIIDQKLYIVKDGKLFDATGKRVE